MTVNEMMGYQVQQKTNTRHRRNNQTVDDDAMRFVVAMMRKNTITNIQCDCNGYCGSQCWFCPVRYEKRPNPKTMSIRSFRKLLAQINEGICAGLISSEVTLWLSGYNDFLMDSHLEERLCALRHYHLKIYATTNAVLLLKNAKLLHAYRDVIRGYTINLPAGNAKDYKQYTMNSEAIFHRIIAGLKCLYNLDPDTYGKNVVIVVNGVGENKRSRSQVHYDLPKGDTRKQVKQILKNLPFRVVVTTMLRDRAGILKDYGVIDNTIIRKEWALPANSKRARWCNNMGNRLYTWIHISSSGHLYTCCQDYREQYAYGSLHHVSLLTLIRSNRRARAICKTQRELCLRCMDAA